MQPIATLSGTGFLRVDAGVPRKVKYTIDIWRNANDVIFGRGRVSGAVETLFAAALIKGPLSLTLDDNQAVDIVITERGAGNDWAEIYVVDPPRR